MALSQGSPSPIALRDQGAGKTRLQPLPIDTTVARSSCVSDAHDNEPAAYCLVVYALGAVDVVLSGWTRSAFYHGWLAEGDRPIARLVGSHVARSLASRVVRTQEHHGVARALGIGVVVPRLGILSWERDV